MAWIEESRLLTLKPIIYVANVAESEVAGEYEDNDYYKQLKNHAKEEGIHFALLTNPKEILVDENGVEFIRSGNYSFAPVFRATSEVVE